MSFVETLDQSTKGFLMFDCTKHPDQNTFHDELYFLATTYNYGTNDTSPIMKKAAFSLIPLHFFQFESMIRLFLYMSEVRDMRPVLLFFDTISIVITGLPFDTFFTENAVAIHASCSK